MAFRSISGSKIVGQGRPQAVPIQLDPVPYEGAVAYGADGLVYVSNGTAWNAVGQGIQGTEGLQGDGGIQGLQGTYGPGFDVIGSVADVDSGGDPQATLNTAFASATVGQAVIDEADDELWVYDGTTWVNVGSFRGVQGFTGLQGDTGAQGERGPDGIQGSRGYRGFQGFQGPQGTTGIQGLQGVQGMQGTQGPQGVQGVQGIQGDFGIQGTQGPQSIQGMQGVQGIQGDTGFQGFSGDDAGHVVEYRIDDGIVEADPGAGDMIMNGAANPTDNFSAVTKIWFNDEAFYSVNLEGLFTAIAAVGTTNKGIVKVTLRNNPSNYMIFQIQGATDRTGYWEFDVTFLSGDGIKSDFVQLNTPTAGVTQQLPTLVAFSLAGDQGIQGTQGVQGPQGTQGVQGLQGVQGIQGAQAAQGIQGDTGIQGMQGTQGHQGIQGDQGFQGAQGTQGHQGTQGAQGMQGTQGHQGTQGFQGFQGLQGGTGTQGFQGTQGHQGTQGIQGAVGHYGGLTHEWNFVSNITASTDPGTSGWKLNTNNVTTATVLTLDDVPLDNYTNDIDETFDWLAAIPGASKGLIVIESFDDGTGPAGHHQVVYEFSNFTWDGSGKTFGWFDITYVGQYGVTSTSWATDVIGGGHGPKTLINFIPRGDAGIQGITGSQGVQGFLGFQGTQGAQGVQGIQGFQGTQGAQGIAGAYGGASFEYDYTPDVTPTGPAGGLIKFNNSDVTLASIMRISDTETNGSNIDAYLRSLDDGGSAVKGYIKIVSIADPAEFLLYSLTGLTENASYYNFNITYLTKSNNADSTYFTNNTDIIFTFTRAGDIGLQGIQGLQGVQGTQSIQGLQGETGAGTQGVQGLFGIQGDLGIQGFPGPIGPQGVQGFYGLQGTGGLQGGTGGFGGVTFDYTYSTNTAATDPSNTDSTGYLKFNNGTMGSVSKMFIDDRDDNFVDIQPFLRTVDDSTSPIKGHFKISEKSAPENFLIFTISGLTETSGYFDIDAAFVSGSVSNFANDADIIITFARTGDVGPSGTQGLQGFDGFQGMQGLQGGPGEAGTQGSQGLQGTQGFQGQSGFVGGDGTQGSQGVQGPQGMQGVAGADGDEGFQGSQGIQGFQGMEIQGVQGFDGSQGFAGVGATGIQGFQGIQGDALQGHQGIQGNDGPAGFGLQGIQGPQSIQGTTGDEGIQGLQGNEGVGDAGVQGVQGIDGDDGAQGFQGLGGEGNQGIQGFQGAAGIGDTGLQGLGGFQGMQGLIGDLGEGGSQGVQGFLGVQGFQGIDGGLGEDGNQGAQGFQGDFGIQGPPGLGSQGLQGHQGFQGDLGVQGFPGQGTQGIQGTQAAQGFQGERGFQGTQGAQGFGPEGGVNNLQNIHDTGLQDTPVFMAMFEGGNPSRPLLGTTGPNPNGESNFFYTSDVDELTVENIQVEGNITVVGTLTASGLAGNQGSLHVPDDVVIGLGSIASSPYTSLVYNAATSALLVKGSTSNMTKIRFTNDSSVDIFTFDQTNGDFTATGDVNANSDERLKDNIVSIDTALEKVCDLRGVYFEMKSRPGVRKAGFIAQEVEKVLPEVVSENDEGIKSVAYGNITALIVEAIKELKDEVNDLKG